MAVWSIELGADTKASAAELESGELWRHYADSGLIYSDKLNAIAPLLPEMLGGWPRTFMAPEDVHLLTVVRRHGELTSSLCRVRDSDRLMLFQHAASQGDPAGMMACIMAAIRWYEAPGRTAGTLGWFFRAENAWPARIVDTVSSALPADAVSIQRRSLLMLHPRQRQHRALDVAAAPVSPEAWNPRLATAVEALVTAVHGRLRAFASCLVNDDHVHLPECRSAFLSAGLDRSRHVHVAWRDGTVAGLAVHYTTSTPVSLSRLDERVEIIVHPHAPDRTGIVGELVAGVTTTAMHTTSALLVLVDEADVAAAAAAGCRNLGRAYTDAVWDLREPEVYRRGRAAALGLYDRVAAAADRRTRVGREAVAADKSTSVVTA